MPEYERGVKGIWIPAYVWLDTNLTALDKMILAEVDSLDQGDKGCYASNKHIADFCGCSESKVSKSISTLIDYGLLYVDNFDGRQRVLKSSLVKNARQPSKKCQAASQKMPERIIDSNINRKINSVRFTPPTLEEVKAYCEERKNHVDPERFIDYYASQKWKKANGRPVSDWRACVRTWEKGDEKKVNKPLNSFHNFEQREDVDFDDIERRLREGWGQ